MSAITSITLGLTILGCGWAGAPDARSSPPSASNSPLVSVQTTTDRLTGVKVRLTKREAASFLVEVDDDFVSVKKSIGPSSSSTTISVRGDTLMIQFASGHVYLTGRGGPLRIEGSTPDAARRLVAFLKQSAAGTAARLLLARMELRSDNVTGRALLLTRALLDSTAGHATDVVAQAQLMSRRRPAVAMPIRYRSLSAVGCWDDYQREAANAATQLQACLKDTSWWNTIGQEICGAMYVIAAETAFAEFLLCSAHLIDAS